MPTDCLVTNMVKGPESHAHTPASLEASENLAGCVAMNQALIVARGSGLSNDIASASPDALNSAISAVQNSGVQRA